MFILILYMVLIFSCRKNALPHHHTVWSYILIMCKDTFLIALNMTGITGSVVTCSIPLTLSCVKNDTHKKKRPSSIMSLTMGYSKSMNSLSFSDLSGPQKIYMIVNFKTYRINHKLACISMLIKNKGQ